MRPASFISAAILPCSFAAYAACRTTPDCNCPEGTIWPSVVIELPCGTTTLPTLTLSGVCAGKGAEQSGRLVFGASDPGICHVELRYEDGSNFATDVAFAAEWLACGSDAHGCGQAVYPAGLPRDGVYAVLVAGPACPEASVTGTALDAAVE